MLDTRPLVEDEGSTDDAERFRLSVPRYQTMDTQALSGTADDTRPKNACFNCGSAEHRASDCPLPRDPVVSIELFYFLDMFSDSTTKSISLHFHSDFQRICRDGEQKEEDLVAHPQLSGTYVVLFLAPLLSRFSRTTSFFVTSTLLNLFLTNTGTWTTQTRWTWKAWIGQRAGADSGPVYYLLLCAAPSVLDVGGYEISIPDPPPQPQNRSLFLLSPIPSPS